MVNNWPYPTTRTKVLVITLLFNLSAMCVQGLGFQIHQSDKINFASVKYRSFELPYHRSIGIINAAVEKEDSPNAHGAKER